VLFERRVIIRASTGVAKAYHFYLFLLWIHTIANGVKSLHKMKRITLFLLVILSSQFIAGKSIAQNSLPKIVSLDAIADTETHKVTIRYSVDDPDSDSLSVSVRIYSPDGNLVENGPDVTGNVSYKVSKTGEKQIVLSYPDTLKSIQSCTVRLMVDDLYKIDIAELVDQVDTTRLRTELSTVVYGVRHSKKPDHINDVRAFIYDSFQKNNLQASKQDIDVSIRKYRFIGQNIIGQIGGTQDEKRSFALTAHFDTQKDSPGADDNGSGVVGMLEAMRILAKYNFKYSIKFIGFDLEETGFIGSREYVAGGIRQDERIEGVINFDMIGYYSDKPESQAVPPGFDQLFPEACSTIAADNYRANFVINTSNEKSVGLSTVFSNSAKKYVPALKVISLTAVHNGRDTPQLAASDHVVFWVNDYQALHIGDGGETRNVNLDTKRDVLGPINYTFISNIVKTSIATLAQLAEIQHSVTATGSIR
jgi:hypothetical protein